MFHETNNTDILQYKYYQTTNILSQVNITLQLTALYNITVKLRTQILNTQILKVLFVISYQL
jgi:hypothetical protein